MTSSTSLPEATARHTASWRGRNASSRKADCSSSRKRSGRGSLGESGRPEGDGAITTRDASGESPAAWGVTGLDPTAGAGDAGKPLEPELIAESAGLGRAATTADGRRQVGGVRCAVAPAELAATGKSELATPSASVAFTRARTWSSI